MSRFTDNQPCPVCNVRMRDHSILRCEPASDLELARIERARVTGKSKAPTWYKAARLPFGANIEPDLKQRYPAHVLSQFTRQSDTWLDIWANGRTAPAPAEDNVQAYVREFERMKHLVTSSGATNG